MLEKSDRRNIGETNKNWEKHRGDKQEFEEGKLRDFNNEN